MSQAPYVLTASCPDRSGIIAKVTQTIAAAGGNIINLSQHSSTDIGHFFCRIEFAVPEPFSRADFEARFEPCAEAFAMEWALHDTALPLRLAILVSKTNHCLYELLLKHEDGQLPCEIPVIISNHSDLAGVATQFHIPFFQVDPGKGKAAYEADMEEILKKYGVELLVMARFMQIISPEMTRRWDNRIINIHHGFLPAFQGAKPYHQAWNKGVKIIGATAHFANEVLDQGPIISQDTIRVSDSRSIQEFVTMGKDVERRVLFEAVRAYLERRVFISGGRTFVL
jgi:formyltetrahydrofolate deformylase